MHLDTTGILKGGKVFFKLEGTVFLRLGLGPGVPSKLEFLLQVLYTSRAPLGVKSGSWSWNSPGSNSLIEIYSKFEGSMPVMCAFGCGEGLIF